MPAISENRYAHAYKIARAAIRMAKILRLCGLCIAGVFIAYGLYNTEQGYWTLAGGGLTTGVVVMVSTLAFYTLLVGQAQLMISGIDTAINTSPLIDLETKARMLEAIE